MSLAGFRFLDHSWITGNPEIKRAVTLLASLNERPFEAVDGRSAPLAKVLEPSPDPSPIGNPTLRKQSCSMLAVGGGERKSRQSAARTASSISGSRAESWHTNSSNSLRWK
jgi:hypothetical protein